MNCACMDTQITLAKKRGPKPSGVKKVVYYRRVTPELVERLDAVLLPPDDGSMMVKDRIEVSAAVIRSIVEDQSELAAIKKQLEAMTASYVDECDQVAALKLKLDLLNSEFDDCLAMTEDDKAKYWRDRAMRTEAMLKAKGGEFNQE